MSEENNGVRDTLDQSVSDGAQETQKTAVSDGGNQTVQYHTHKKLLSQHKNAMSELEQMRERITLMETEKLEAEGNKDQLIESLKKQVQERDGKLKKTVGSIAQRNAMSAIVEEAVKAGCDSPGFVKKFLKDEIGTLQFDEEFEPDRDQVRELVMKAREEAPKLFGKEAPKIANHNTSRGATSDKSKSLKKMSMDELMNEWGNS